MTGYLVSLLMGLAVGAAYGFVQAGRWKPVGRIRRQVYLQSLRGRT
jgi:hypothetical protein